MHVKEQDAYQPSRIQHQSQQDRHPYGKVRTAPAQYQCNMPILNTFTTSNSS